MAIILRDSYMGFLSGDVTDTDTLRKLVTALRKHERAAASFLSQLRKLDDDKLRLAFNSLGASWRLEVAKNALPLAVIAPTLDAVHSQALDCRNAAKVNVFEAADVGAFDDARRDSDYITVLDRIMVTAANLKNSITHIETLKAANVAA